MKSIGIYFIPFYDVPEGTYFFLYNDSSTENCPSGSNITDAVKCKEACKELNITVKKAESIESGYVCYKDIQGNCYQDGRNDERTSLVCEQMI